MIILIDLDLEWEPIRDQFSEEEKQTLRNAIVGQVLCPPMVHVDTDLLSYSLARKLKAALAP